MSHRLGCKTNFNADFYASTKKFSDELLIDLGKLIEDLPILSVVELKLDKYQEILRKKLYLLFRLAIFNSQITPQGLSYLQNALLKSKNLYTVTFDSSVYFPPFLLM